MTRLANKVIRKMELELNEQIAKSLGMSDIEKHTEVILPKFYDIKQFCDILSVSRCTLMRWIKNGLVLAVQVNVNIDKSKRGGVWRIPSAELDRLTKVRDKQ